MFPFSRKRTGLITVGGAIAALLAAGCSHQDDTPPAQVNTTTVTPPAPAPGATVVTTTPGSTTPPGPMSSTNNTNAGAGGATGTETAVADAVNKAIHNNAQMTGSRITAVVNASGEARLTGTAQNQQQKALAESTAHQTSGVSSVINKVEIVPTGGVKSAVQPATKTKIIVVHDKAPAPAPTVEAAPSMSAPTPAGPDSSAGRTAGTGGTAAGNTAPPASGTGTTAP